jgi:DNA-binding NarL/FixJ family response regulator
VPTILLIEAAEKPHIQGVLKDAGGLLKVIGVSSLEEGLAVLRAPDHGVSAVLLDLSLPESRDLTAIERLRQIVPGTAIMVLAPAVDQPLARRAVYRGATEVVDNAVGLNAGGGFGTYEGPG